jgi:hypothetical protein
LGFDSGLGLRASWLTKLLGDFSEGVTPVPIPNTEVKPLSPDGTALATVWESRTSPGLNQRRPQLQDWGLFHFLRSFSGLRPPVFVTHSYFFPKSAGRMLDRRLASWLGAGINTDDIIPMGGLSSQTPQVRTTHANHRPALT